MPGVKTWQAEFHFIVFYCIFLYTLNLPYTCLSYCFTALYTGFQCACLCKDAGNSLYSIHGLKGGGEVKSNEVKV